MDEACADARRMNRRLPMYSRTLHRRTPARIIQWCGIAPLEANVRQLAAYLLVFAGVCWPTTGDRDRFELSVFLHDVLLLDIFHFCKKNVYIACQIVFI